MKRILSKITSRARSLILDSAQSRPSMTQPTSSLLKPESVVKNGTLAVIVGYTLPLAPSDPGCLPLPLYADKPAGFLASGESPYCV